MSFTSDISAVGKRLFLARNMLGLSRRKFNEKFKVSVNTLQAWESGKNPLSPKVAKMLSQYFLDAGLICSQDWLIEGNGTLPRFVNTEILENAPQKNTNVEKEIYLEIETFNTVNSDPIVMTIPDDTMLPFYKAGDYVAGNKKYKEDINKYLGCNCIIETIEGITLCRKLAQGELINTYTLLCTNLDTKEASLVISNIKLNFVAEVIWHRKRSAL